MTGSLITMPRVRSAAQAELSGIQDDLSEAASLAAGALERLRDFIAGGRWRHLPSPCASAGEFITTHFPVLADLAIPVPERRALVVLLAGERMTQKAIAGCLGVDQATVSRDMQMHTARPRAVGPARTGAEARRDRDARARQMSRDGVPDAQIRRTLRIRSGTLTRLSAAGDPAAPDRPAPPAGRPAAGRAPGRSQAGPGPAAPQGPAAADPDALIDALTAERDQLRAELKAARAGCEAHSRELWTLGRDRDSDRREIARLASARDLQNLLRVTRYAAGRAPGPGAERALLDDLAGRTRELLELLDGLRDDAERAAQAGPS